MKDRFTSKIEERVFKNILEKKLLKKGDNLIVSLSGGPDSTFLIYILDLFNKKYNYNLTFNVMHLNHMLRKEAKRDENFAKKIAEKYNAIFYVKEVDVEKKSKEEKTSIELAGRNARNEFINEISKKINKNNIKIVYGHHADDVAETFMLNLLRGTSLRGMTSIKEKNGNKIRPIIFLHKDEILKYLDKKQIDYVIDQTNFGTEYMRNKIRNIVFPYFEKNINDKSRQNIYLAAQSANEAMEYIDEISNFEKEKLEKNISVNNFLKEMQNKKMDIEIEDIKYFEINSLKKLNDIILKNIIYKYIEKIRVNKGIIEDILSLIKNNKGNKYINIENKKIFYTKKSKIYILNLKEKNGN